MAQSTIWTASPSPRAIASSVVAEKSGIASTCRPRYPASNRSQVAARRMPVTSLITSFSAASDVAASKSPHCVATIPRPFRAMDNGARAPDARASSTCRVLNVTQLSKSHTAMAAIWARIPHCSHSSPDTLIAEECVHCAPQGRLCRRAPVGDHRRQTVEEEITRSGSLRRLWGRSCRSGDLEEMAAGPGERTSDGGCDPGVRGRSPGRARHRVVRVCLAACRSRTGASRPATDAHSICPRSCSTRAR